MSLIEVLQLKLSNELPGSIAHAEMYPRTTEQVRLKNTDNTTTKEAAVLLLLYPSSQGLSFPLIKRTTYPGVHSGQIALPGGKKELWEENLIETALREANEEIGVNASDIKVLGTLSDIMVSVSNTMVCPVVGYISYEPVFKAQVDEVAEIIQADLDQFINKTTIQEKEITIGNSIKILAPHFNIKGHIVWGATAMMLNEFKKIVVNGY